MTDKKTVSSSPVSKKKMDFYEGLKQVLVGRKIRRTEWPVEEYCFMKDGLLMIFKNNINHTWTISDGDMTGLDWVAV